MVYLTYLVYGSNSTPATMTQVSSKIKDQIKSDVETSKKFERICKVYFKLRTPMIGFFTALHDDEELSAKGMVRFVPGGKEEMFHATRQTMWTRIFVVSDFIDLEFVKNGQKI